MAAINSPSSGQAAGVNADALALNAILYSRSGQKNKIPSAVFSSVWHLQDAAAVAGRQIGGLFNSISSGYIYRIRYLSMYGAFNGSEATSQQVWQGRIGNADGINTDDGGNLFTPTGTTNESSTSSSYGFIPVTTVMELIMPRRVCARPYQEMQFGVYNTEDCYILPGWALAFSGATTTVIGDIFHATMLWDKIPA